MQDVFVALPLPPFFQGAGFPPHQAGRHTIDPAAAAGGSGRDIWHALPRCAPPGSLLSR